VLSNAAQEEANASYGKLKHCDPLEAEAMLNYEYNWPIEAWLNDWNPLVE